MNQQAEKSLRHFIGGLLKLYTVWQVDVSALANQKRCVTVRKIHGCTRTQHWLRSRHTRKELPYASFPRTIRRHSRTSSSQLRAHPHYGGAPVTNLAQAAAAAAAAAESCAHLSRSSLPHAMHSGIASPKAGKARGGGGIGTVQTGPASQSLKAQGCAKRLASRLMRERCEKGPYDILELVLCSEVLTSVKKESTPRSSQCRLPSPAYWERNHSKAANNEIEENQNRLRLEAQRT
ncbi:hypothetical protein C8J57DRAFT_1246448 [Mycena rebaudengoi]|nr:hypothetical protein C8J57DRAFT_1246448 [Mycena rebaudengoi]